MDIDSNINKAHSKQKHGFFKIKKLLKPFFPKSSTFSKKTVDKNNKMPIYLYQNHGLKLFTLHNRGKVTVTTSLNTYDANSSDDNSINSVDTWASENEEDNIRYDGRKENNTILLDTIDSIEKTKNHDLMNVASSISTGLMNSNSNHTLYIKGNNDDYSYQPSTTYHPLRHEFSLESNNESNNSSFLSEDSISYHSSISIDSFNNKYYINIPTKICNKTDNKNDNTINLPLSPPRTPSRNSQHSKAETTNTYLQQNYSKIKTPPILSYFPSEILIHIAMSSDFDTLLNLRQTCRFFHTVLSHPCNWTDYWKYTNDHIECLNSLVTSVYQSDEYIFGEVLDPMDDKSIIFNRRKDAHNSNFPYSSSSSSSSSSFSSSYMENQHIPNFIYKMPSINNDSEKEEIPIERILFIDSFSTRFGFSYLGGLRIYVPYDYGNVIVHFFDRPAPELPCSLEHYQEYERNQLGGHLLPTTPETTNLPHSVQNCPQCLNYFQRNCIDYTVTCSGRPVSHISAIWKYHVSPKYTFSFDIINARSENGYGYRTQDAFIHTNYSFLVNGQELSPEKAALFRNFVLKSSK